MHKRERKMGSKYRKKECWEVDSEKKILVRKVDTEKKSKSAKKINYLRKEISQENELGKQITKKINK